MRVELRIAVATPEGGAVLILEPGPKPGTIAAHLAQAADTNQPNVHFDIPFTELEAALSMLRRMPPDPLPEGDDW